MISCDMDAEEAQQPTRETGTGTNEREGGLFDNPDFISILEKEMNRGHNVPKSLSDMKDLLLGSMAEFRAEADKTEKQYSG